MANDMVNEIKHVTHETLFPERYRWWHAVGFGLGANALSALSLKRQGQEEQFYEQQRQAPFAPPAWAFGPAWTINNMSVLWGNLRLLNLPEDTPHRQTLLWLQAASWAMYSTFSYVYFRKRSPILAFVWTAGMYALTIPSALLAWKIDRKIAWSFLTLLLWLSIATPTALYQMLYNPDPLFDSAPLIEPDEA
ncbi:MAG TPA: TspO/MBR family protein [Roseiflexaceae bacterium]|jgi:tryptophan-rich sensory protein|nr:TspO/MBR family protein [Roseiflexaceae bacterium]